MLQPNWSLACRLQIIQILMLLKRGRVFLVFPMDYVAERTSCERFSESIAIVDNAPNMWFLGTPPRSKRCFWNKTNFQVLWTLSRKNLQHKLHHMYSSAEDLLNSPQYCLPRKHMRASWALRSAWGCKRISLCLSCLDNWCPQANHLIRTEGRILVLHLSFLSCREGSTL